MRDIKGTVERTYIQGSNETCQYRAQGWERVVFRRPNAHREFSARIHLSVR